MARRQLDVRVTAKWHLAPDVVGLRLMPGPGEGHLRRLPGQYLDVLLEDGRRRPFSIASGPQADAAIEWHARHVAGGGFTSLVDTTLRVDDKLRIEGPLGTFVPREDSERPMLSVAGGTGIAPIKAIVEHFIALGTQRPMELYRGGRSAADLYLLELARQWVRDVPKLRLQAVVSDPESGVSLRRGLVHEAVLEDFPDLSAHDVYMSGPPALVDAGRQLFIDAGAPESNVYFDTFDYAPDVLAQMIAGRARFTHWRVDGGDHQSWSALPRRCRRPAPADALPTRHVRRCFATSVTCCPLPPAVAPHAMPGCRQPACGP
ncbi:MAG: FAD-binding oxidoreductase [Rhodanobacter sp.]